MDNKNDDIAVLKTCSLKNIEVLEQAVGPHAMHAIPNIIARHQNLLSLALFHETTRANIDQIKKAGKILSYDLLSQENTQPPSPGMTIKEKTVSDMFNNVSHSADRYTNFVYMRPIFGDTRKSDCGIFWPQAKISDDMWFQFRDPNQLTQDDNYNIQMGIGVTTSFDESDVYVGNDIVRAMVLQTISQIAQIDYKRKLRKHLYDIQVASYKGDPTLFLPPDEKDNMNLDEAVSHYENIALSYYTAYETYKDVTFCLDQEERAEIEKKGLALKYCERPALSQEALQHPNFDAFFESRFRTIAADVSKFGQIAVPNEKSLDGAQIIAPSYGCATLKNLFSNKP